MNSDFIYTIQYHSKKKKESLKPKRKDKLDSPMSKADLKRMEREKKERVKRKKEYEKERRIIEKKKIKDEKKKVKEEIKELKSDFKNREANQRRSKKRTHKVDTDENPRYEDLKRFYDEHQSESSRDGNSERSSTESFTTVNQDSTDNLYKDTTEKVREEKNPKTDTKITKKKSPKKSRTRSKSKSKKKKKSSRSTSAGKSPKRVKIKKNKKEKTKSGKSPKRKKHSKKVKVNYALLDKSTQNTKAFRRDRRKKTKIEFQPIGENLKQSVQQNMKDKKILEKQNAINIRSNHDAAPVAKNCQDSRQKRFMMKAERIGHTPWDRIYSSERLICSQSLKTLDSIIY